jgi:GT2 family glycosyltransferase
MDVDAQLAPPVVAVLVAHDPGEWFDDVVSSLAAQDYPNLKVLVLSTGTVDVAARVKGVVPGAFVRSMPGNPGFGRTANEVLRLVEGESGFFCFLHDDVALDPGAIRMLVEELYRSNAGIVGPKLVDWDDPGVLQHVGLAVDHFAAVDVIVEPGERDQEQHDAVRDVFALPSACLLVRADLFRALGGFDPAIDYHGEDIDLCWRAHLGGARVVVVPSARGRHREGLVERRPDIDHVARRARHRMRAYATLTGTGRALARLPLLVLTTIVELVTGIFTGRAAEGTATFTAMLGLVPRLGSVLRRRSVIRPLRVVPDREIAELQIRGSARRTAHRRSGELVGSSSTVSTFTAQLPREGSALVVAGWLTLVALLVIGARGLITDGAAAIGEMLPYPSRGDLLETYRSGWWDSGLGETAAQPTAFALIAVGGVMVLGKMGLLHTLGILVPVLIGYIGVWRLMSVLGSSRARMVSTAAYAAVPLPYAAIGAGRWGVLAAYAVVPWALHAVRRVSGWSVPGEAAAGPDDVDLVGLATTGERVRLSAGLVVVLALGLAFSPAVVVVVVLAAAVWLVATALVRGSVVTAAVGVAATVVGAVGAFALNLPWSVGLLGGDSWNGVAGAPLASPRDIGLLGLARFDIGPDPLSIVTIGLYVTALVSIVVSQKWRLGWAARGAGLVVVFLGLAVLDDRGSLPVRMPEPGVLLVPVAVGLAICAGCTVSAVSNDVRGARFGLRQPLGLLGTVTLLLALLPVAASAVDGRYQQPGLTLVEQVDSVLRADPPEGDYRTLYLGDPRVIPVAPLRYADGVAYALVDDGPLGVTDAWVNAPDVQGRLISAALDAVAQRDTGRVGRVLAPLAIRYIVLPVHDGVASTSADPIDLPVGLVDALEDQLDLRRAYSPRDIIVFENTAWIPTRSMLSPGALAASGEAGLASLVGADLTGSQPVMVGAEATDEVLEDLPAGAFHLAVAVDERWTLSVDGTAVDGRPSFGYSTTHELPSPVTAVLEYRTDAARTLWVAVQAGLWALVLLATTRLLGRLRAGRAARAPTGPAETLIAIDDDGVFATPPLAAPVTQHTPPTDPPPVDPPRESDS